MQKFESLKIPAEMLADPDVQRLKPYATKLSEGKNIDELAYTILDVQKDAPHSDIQKAYRDLARKFHPDKTTIDPKFFTIVGIAYSIVGDVDAREVDKQVITKREAFDHFIDPLFNFSRNGETFKDFYDAAVKAQKNGTAMPWEETFSQAAHTSKENRSEYDPRVLLRNGQIPDTIPRSREDLAELKECSVKFIIEYGKYPARVLEFLNDLARTHSDLYKSVTADRDVHKYGTTYTRGAMRSGDAFESLQGAIVFNLPRRELNEVQASFALHVASDLQSSNKVQINNGLNIITDFNTMLAQYKGFPALKHIHPLHLDTTVRRQALDLGRNILCGNSPLVNVLPDIISTMRFEKGRNATFWNNLILEEAKVILNDRAMTHQDKKMHMSDLVMMSYPTYIPIRGSKLDDFTAGKRFRGTLRETCQKLRIENGSTDARELAHEMGLSQPEYKKLLRLTPGEAIRWAIGNSIRATGRFIVKVSNGLSNAIWPEGLNSKEPRK